MIMQTNIYLIIAIIEWLKKKKIKALEKMKFYAAYFSTQIDNSYPIIDTWIPVSNALILFLIGRRT